LVKHHPSVHRDPSLDLWILRKDSEDISGWRIKPLDKWLVIYTLELNSLRGRYVSGVCRVQVPAEGKKGGVAGQAPGIALSSFPAGLKRQGLRKNYRKNLPAG